MSLLTPIPGTQLPTALRLRNDVSRIKAAPRRITDQLVRDWEGSFDLLWSNDGDITPAQRLAEIGTDAAELFAASTALVTFIVATVTGKDDALAARLVAKLEAMPAITKHEDGRVTIN